MKRLPCAFCDDKGWVCGMHPSRPAVMFSDRADACKCGGAPEPCIYCNMPSPDNEREISRGASDEFDKNTWKQ
jgi:hypothetical protein